ncbi:MAG: hypothetical protein LHW64_05665 [Candidatus Cloacimonetes bacterium]|jgi:hypothetical protein|nr:hypothetical protein [Candidatus Cloacimonadota bacterium]MCB5287269.1 hypothetical protein [Candidatus Cloacimonadota bacterium]MCK9183810.1 hypothetical protein [Candidatus Cloacimonadota bacterium]MCK9584919.1 hypothetical protein [Candidatus Cloacimonadota bacterium]MDY0229591.1 hypothetical protein [Candidatus Cloacimonadaceae bacterium]
MKKIVANGTEISAYLSLNQVKITMEYLVDIYYLLSLLIICAICVICERLFAKTLKTALQEGRGMKPLHGRQDD